MALWARQISFLHRSATVICWRTPGQTTSAIAAFRYRLFWAASIVSEPKKVEFSSWRLITLTNLTLLWLALVVWIKCLTLGMRIKAVLKHFLSHLQTIHWTGVHQCVIHYDSQIGKSASWSHENPEDPGPVHWFCWIGSSWAIHSSWNPELPPRFQGWTGSGC